MGSDSANLMDMLQLGVAAFMNLSLRSRGKDLCAEQPDRVLSKK